MTLNPDPTPTVDVASNRLDARLVARLALDARHRADPDWSLESPIGVADRFARAVALHVEAGEGDLAELALLAALADTVEHAIDVLAVRLRADGYSNREIGVALGRTRTAVHERYKGAPSPRRPGGQPHGMK